MRKPLCFGIVQFPGAKISSAIGRKHGEIPLRKNSWRYLWLAKPVRNRILITLGILVLYRLIANIPVPGFNAQVIQALNSSTNAATNIIGMLNILSGGTLSTFSILAMGVYPYITASIILQLLIPIIPALNDKVKKCDDPKKLWMERGESAADAGKCLVYGRGNDDCSMARTGYF